MGWREFRAWLEVLERQVQGRRADPGSWQGADQDPGWIELRRKRDELEGRV